MPYCPICQAEYRPGFTTCKTCDDEPLVDVLPERIELGADEIESALGVTPAVGPDEPVTVDGVEFDALRVFPLPAATEIKRVLDRVRIAAAIVPLEVELADQIPRFEVRVREADHPRAEAHLQKLWKEQAAAEGFDVEANEDVESCPACGAHVPLTAHECPECGLVVGAGADEASGTDEEP